MIFIPQLPLGVPLLYMGFSAPDNYAFVFGQSVLRATYPSLFDALTTTATVTFSNGAGSLKCTWAGHPFPQTNMAVYTAISFTAGTSTPTGITAGTVYYVLPNDSTTFFLSTTPGGSAITYTNSGTGTQTATAIFYGAADSTHFNLPDMRGRTVSGRDNMGGSAAGRLTSGITGGIGNGIVLGSTGGEQSHVLTVTELAAHNHNFGTSANATTVGGDTPFAKTQDAQDETTSNTGSDAAHNTLSPAIVCNYIMRLT